MGIPNPNVGIECGNPESGKLGMRNVFLRGSNWLGIGNAMMYVLPRNRTHWNVINHDYNPNHRSSDRHHYQSGIRVEDVRKETHFSKLERQE